MRCLRLVQKTLKDLPVSGKSSEKGIILEVV